jgi:2-iminobutanoate/2-iminopropanoate deaminase
VAASPVALSSAPPVKGPYSAAVMAGGLVAFSGQIALDADTGQMLDGSAGRQLEVILVNLFRMAAELDAGPADFVLLNVYLTDLDHLLEVNSAYERSFGEYRPARALIGIAALPFGAAVEVQAWLALPSTHKQTGAHVA